MTDFTERIEALSPSKRELLKVLLQDQDAAAMWRQEEYVAPSNTIEQTLADIWSQILGVERVGVLDNFFELGGDSIQCIQIVARARQERLHLTTNLLFEHPTITELARAIQVSDDRTMVEIPIGGSIPLAPIQRWFFEQKLPAINHWNESVLLELKCKLSPAVLQQALQRLLEHHDALRLRFEETKTGWQQVNTTADNAIVFQYIDLSHLEIKQQQSAIEREAASIQSGLNIMEGPLVKTALFELGGQRPDYLLLAIHHLAVDAVSFRILLEDLSTACLQITQGEFVQLPGKTNSYQHWTQLLNEFAQTASLLAELPYWLEQSCTTRLPRELDAGPNRESSARTAHVSLTKEETAALLRGAPATLRAQVNEILLTAVVATLVRWIGNPALVIDIEGHGREELIPGIDLTRTVGWFTSIFPVRFDLSTQEALPQQLEHVKGRLRKAPRRGIGYGLLRYCAKAPEAEKLRATQRSEIVFNYLGQFDANLSESSWFTLASENGGPPYGPENPRLYLLQIVGSVIGGQMRVSWVYSANIHLPSTMERLANDFAQTLRALIAEAESTHANRLTPSDFPEAEMTQEDLGRILAGEG